MFLFLRFSKLLRIIFLFIYTLGFSNIKNPFYENTYMARIYDNKDIDMSIKNGACTASYDEIIMDNLKPEPNSAVKQFKMAKIQISPFYNPYLAPSKKTFINLQIGFDSDPVSLVSIPIQKEIPSYAKSIGIILGGDGSFNPDILYFIIKDGSKVRHLAVEGFHKNTYTLFILPLGSSTHIRTLSKVILRHRFKTNASKLYNSSISIGPISFYDFKVPQLQEVEMQDPIYTPLVDIQPKQNISNVLGQEYTLKPFGLWHNEDTLFLNIKNLKSSTLEVYLNLRDRIKKGFLLRLLVAPINNNKEAISCIQIKLPKEVIEYQQKTTKGIYFSLKGLKFIPTEGKNNTNIDNILLKSFLQRKTWSNKTYPLDKE